MRAIVPACCLQLWDNESSTGISFVHVQSIWPGFDTPLRSEQFAKETSPNKLTILWLVRSFIQQCFQRLRLHRRSLQALFELSYQTVEVQ